MTHVPKAICGCGFQMKAAKNGVVLQGKIREPNSKEPVPYYKISSDRFECPNCLNAVYLPARVPMVFQHEENFANVVSDKDFVFV
jgi:hypothetical protein